MHVLSTSRSLRGKGPMYLSLTVIIATTSIVLRVLTAISATVGRYEEVEGVDEFEMTTAKTLSPELHPAVLEVVVNRIATQQQPQTKRVLLTCKHTTACVGITQ